MTSHKSVPCLCERGNLHCRGECAPTDSPLIQFERMRAALNRIPDLTLAPATADDAARLRDSDTHMRYLERQKSRRARLIGDIAVGLGIVILLTAAVSLAFIFIWAGFDAGLIDSWLR